MLDFFSFLKLYKCKEVPPFPISEPVGTFLTALTSLPAFGVSPCLDHLPGPSTLLPLSLRHHFLDSMSAVPGPPPSPRLWNSDWNPELLACLRGKDKQLPQALNGLPCYLPLFFPLYFTLCFLFFL